MTDGHTDRLEAALDGRYRIERKLGEGGMASVYLAEDIKHKRKVALKILRPELAAVIGAERFLAEIQTTANLQHPHILALFDSGEAGGYLYYVMPYIDGETLREKLDREKQLGVEEAVRIARDVADALDYAHRAGVIHRDIKPGNILLHDGRPVVADFGIALAVSAAGGGRMTETGLSLGTPHYMSPEQASADRDLSARSDVYSLGCVLYEMLAGQPPHIGPSAQSILVHILTKDVVPLTEHRHTVPPHISATVAKAIEKLPADRFESAKDFMEALGDEGFTYQAGYRSAPGAAVRPPASATSSRELWNPLSVGLATLLLTSLAVMGWALRRPPQPTATSRLAVDAAGWAGPRVPIGRFSALAPDGSSMVLPSAGNSNTLSLKSRSSSEITVIPGTEGARDVVYSPDAQWIAYAVGSEVRKRPLIGGSAVTLAQDADGGAVPMAWLEDGTILYEQAASMSRANPLVRIDEDSGAPLGPAFEPEANPRWVHGLPGGRGALVTLLSTELHVVDLENGTSRLIGEEIRRAWYTPTGHLVYVSTNGAVFAATFDLQALELTGSAIPMFEGVRISGDYADMLLAPDGTLLYAEGAAGGLHQALWVDRRGQLDPIDSEWTFIGDPTWSSLALSPDDSRLALSLLGEDGRWDLWIKSLEGGMQLRRFTFSGDNNRRPSWSPDGQFVTFVRGFSDNRGGQEVMRARYDGTGEMASVVGSESLGRHALNEALYSATGEWLVYRVGSTTDASNPDIYALEVGVDSVGQPLLAEEYTEWTPALSPDDRWLAYASDQSGRQEVYVRPFPDVETGVWQISTSGGSWPKWSRDGTELYFQNGQNELAAVEVGGRASFTFGTPVVLFEMSPFLGGAGSAKYDVSSDGQRFVVLGPPDDTSAGVILVQNWFTELSERVDEN